MSLWLKISLLIYLSIGLLSCGTAPSGKTNRTDAVHYLGRYEVTDTGDYRMGWPGSGFGLRFRGTQLAVTLTDDGQGIMDAVINGASSALVLQSGTHDYTIVTSDRESLFDVSLTRRTEVLTSGVFEINDIRIDGERVARDLPLRKILFIGDSITAGYGVRGNTNDCRYTPASNAPLKSYAALAANALGAEPHLIAISGRGVVSNYAGGGGMLMPQQIDKALPDRAAIWDHSLFMADAVVVNLGTNDWSASRPDQAKFNKGYANLITDIRARFPNAEIIMASGPMLNSEKNAAVQAGIEAAIKAVGGERLSAVNLSLSDTQLKWGCDYHPGRDSMVKMANDLTAHISKRIGWTAKPVPLPNDLKISPPRTMKKGGKKHYASRVAAIAQQPPLDGGILFLGDSITEAGDWAAFFPDVKTANHGIGWDTVGGLRARLPQIIINNPDKIFIMIGTNDIGYDHDPIDMAAKLEDVIKVLRSSRPKAKLYLQSVLPREESNAAKVAAINRQYAALAKDMQMPFITLTPAFADASGGLRRELTDDGLHLNAAGYAVWSEAIRSYAAE